MHSIFFCTFKNYSRQNIINKKAYCILTIIIALVLALDSFLVRISLSVRSALWHPIERRDTGAVIILFILGQFILSVYVSDCAEEACIRYFSYEKNFAINRIDKKKMYIISHLPAAKRNTVNFNMIFWLLCCSSLFSITCLVLLILQAIITRRKYIAKLRVTAKRVFAKTHDSRK